MGTSAYLASAASGSVVSTIVTVLNAGASVAGVSPAVSTKVDGASILDILQNATGSTMITVPAASSNALRIESPNSVVELIAGQEVRLKPSDANVIRVDGTPGIGFNGSAPVAKGTITGSRATGAAVASLLTYLASRGDIIDSSSA